MAAGRGPHHPPPRGRRGPEDRPRPIPRGAPRVQAPPRRAPGDHRGPLVAAVPPEALGETGPRAARRLRRGLLRIPPERHDGGRELVPRDRAEHLRAALEPSGTPRHPRDAADGPDAIGPAPRGGPRGVLQVQPRARFVRPAGGPRRPRRSREPCEEGVAGKYRGGPSLPRPDPRTRADGGGRPAGHPAPPRGRPLRTRGLRIPADDPSRHDDDLRGGGPAARPAERVL